MRNLKRSLSLALAAAMLISLMGRRRQRRRATRTTRMPPAFRMSKRLTF